MASYNRSREAQAFPPTPLGVILAGESSLVATAKVYPKAQAIGNSFSSIDEDVRKKAKVYLVLARLFAIAASASGAIILYPAAFGCSPSSASSRLSKPLSSTIGVK